MMISPEMFREMHEKDSLEECYKVRREIMGEIIDYESSEELVSEYVMNPSPEVIYSINNLYLIEICKLIEEKKYKDF